MSETEQDRAVAGRGSRLISAGAGAGKTSTLVRMVADAIDADVPEDQIMVSTFTRRAAGELTERVLEELTRRDRHGVRVEEIWLNTLDACFASLLREAALGIGLPPATRVAQSHEIARQRRACALIAENHEIERLPVFDALIPLSPERREALLADLYGKAVSLGKDPRETDCAPPAAVDLDLVQDLERLAIEIGLPGPSDRIRRDAAALREARVPVEDAPRWSVPDAFRERAEALRSAFVEASKNLADFQTAPARAAFAAIVRRYAVERILACQRDGLLGYDDATLLLRDGLQRGLVHRRFTRMFVDEAQDTNPAQREILRGLLAENGELVMIGDMNQSVYAFRFADPRGFEELGEQLGRRDELVENHRTQGQLLNAISAIAERIDDPPLAGNRGVMKAQKPPEDGAPPATVLVVGTSNVRIEAAHAVAQIERMRTELDLEHRDVAVLCGTNAAAEAYADALRALDIESIHLRRGGILGAPECVAVLEYLRALSAADDVHLGAALCGPFMRLGDAEVCEVFEGSADRLERLRALKPAIHAGFQRHRSWIGRLRPADLVSRVIEETGYLEACAERRDGRVSERNVAGLIDRIGELDGRSLAQILEDLAEEAADAAADESAPARPSPDQNAIQVMTVHAAKGLEFPLVVVGALGEPYGGWPPAARINSANQIGLRARHESRDIEDRTYAVAREEHGLEDKAEERRRVYVAMTRAERGLLLVLGNGNKGPATWLRPIVMRGVRNRDPGPTDVSVGEGTLRVYRIPITETGSARLEEVTASEPVPIADRREGLAPMPRPASFTSISSWRRCGLRRRFETDLGLAARNVPLEGGSGSAAYGLAMHRALRKVDWRTPNLEGLVSGLPIETRERATEQMLRLRGASDLLYRLADARSIRQEVRFRFSGPPPLRGVMDLLALDDALLVVDWKTGDDEEQVFQADHDLQRQIYALAALTAAESPTRVDCWWVHLADDPLRIERRSFSPGERDGLAASLSKAIADCFAMTPTAAANGSKEPFCKGCPGSSGLCPAIS